MNEYLHELGGEQEWEAARVAEDRSPRVANHLARAAADHAPCIAMHSNAQYARQASRARHDARFSTNANMIRVQAPAAAILCVQSILRRPVTLCACARLLWVEGARLCAVLGVAEQLIVRVDGRVLVFGADGLEPIRLHDLPM
jgi:hypothetical protein